MKTKEFFDQHHAQTYLIHTIIRKNNIPIFITNVDQTNDNRKKWRLDYQILGNNEENLLFLPSKDINMNPVTLGMLNAKNNGVRLKNTLIGLIEI